MCECDPHRKDENKQKEPENKPELKKNLFQDIIHMYKMQQLKSPFERTKSHEELETPTYTTTIPPKFS